MNTLDETLDECSRKIKKTKGKPEPAKKVIVEIVYFMSEIGDFVISEKCDCQRMQDVTVR